MWAARAASGAIDLRIERDGDVGCVVDLSAMGLWALGLWALGLWALGLWAGGSTHSWAVLPQVWA